MREGGRGTYNVSEAAEEEEAAACSSMTTCRRSINSSFRSPADRGLMADGSGNAELLEGRLSTARFYGDHLLPEVHALVRPATAGAGQLFAASL